MKAPRFAVHPALAACLFLSGAAGLAYEVLWARILGLFFGHTVYAVTTVLAAFMGGLALGSRVFGKISDGVANPLRLYALLEIGIGVFCLAVPDLVAAARAIYLGWVPGLPSSVPILTLARFAITLPVLLVPTTMMGGTFPAVCRHLVRAAADSGRPVGLAYGLNTLGAAFGALSVGYWLIPAIGVRACYAAAVCVNLLAAAAAFALAAREAPAPADRDATAEEERGGPADADARILVGAFAVSGAAGMAFEIVWSRALVLVIGSSTYAYSTILTIFLLGIGLGSVLFARLRLRPSALMFGRLQVCAGIAAFLMIPAFDHLPKLFLLLFRAAGGSFPVVLGVKFIVVGIVLLLPTALSGMTFPCAAALCARRTSSFGGELGRLYAWNTVGAIIGACATGFFAVPLLGAQTTLVLAVEILVLSGILVIRRSEQSWRRAAAPALAAVAVAAALFVPWDLRTMSSGVFYKAARAPNMSDDLFRTQIREVLYFREGVSSTVSVVLFDSGVTSLLVNGKVDANNGSDMETQVKLANIPLLLHPDPARIAVIGLGSGITVGISTLYDAPRRIDVVELEEAVVKASDCFRRENFGALGDPRVRLHIDDASSFIEAAPSGYDVIISEPSNPWMAGVGNLYTREFFRKARGKLAKGGIYCQWLQGYAFSAANFRMVLRTFLDVFPSSTLWTGAQSDFMLIGFRDRAPAPMDARTLDARAFRNARLCASLRFLGDSPTDSVMASFFLDTPEMRMYAGAGERNTDDLPLLEFRAPASLYLRDTCRVLKAEMLARRVNPYPSFFRDPRYEKREAHLRLAGFLERKERPDEASFHYRLAAKESQRKPGPGNPGRRRRPS